MNLLIVQFSPLPCYLVYLRPKFSPQYLTLKHPQSTFLPQCERPSFTPVQKRQNYIYILIFVFLDSKHKVKIFRCECQKHFRGLNLSLNPSCNGLGSSVGIATSYRLDGQRIESQWGTRFSVPVQTGPGAHPASCTMGTGSFPEVKSGRGVTLTPNPLLVPRS